MLVSCPRASRSIVEIGDGSCEGEFRGEGGEGFRAPTVRAYIHSTRGTVPSSERAGGEKRGDDRRTREVGLEVAIL